MVFGLHSHFFFRATRPQDLQKKRGWSMIGNKFERVKLPFFHEQRVSLLSDMGHHCFLA